MPDRERHLLLMDFLLLAARIDRRPTWAGVVRAACQYGAGVNPPAAAAEFNALAQLTIRQFCTPGEE
jgi:hypothetical protein